MTSPWLDPLLFALTCVGGGGILVSLRVGLVPHGRTLTTQAADLLLLLLALTAALFAALAASLGQPLSIWGPPATLAGLYLLLVVVPSAACAGMVVLACRALGSSPARRLIMLALWGFCPFAALGFAYSQYQGSAAEDYVPDTEVAIRMLAAVAEEDPVSPLTTDLGRAVRTLHVKDGLTVPLLELLASQSRLLKQFELEDGVIQLPLGWQDTNCHGFVFTGGRHRVGGSQVDSILDDNGYLPVNSVQAGDLAIYRDQSGAVAHSGIVCGLAADGVILVESKWGQIGRFIHRHDRHVYPDTECTFYRSARQGHLLRGVYATPAEESLPLSTPGPTVPATDGAIGL